MPRKSESQPKANPTKVIGCRCDNEREKRVSDVAEAMTKEIRRTNTNASEVPLAAILSMCLDGHLPSLEKQYKTGDYAAKRKK